MRKITFSTQQVDAAAQFIFKHNHSLVGVHRLSSWEQVKEMIIDEIRRVAATPMNKQIPDWTSCGGWISIFTDSEERTDHHECEVFVDPAIAVQNYLVHDNFVGAGESND
jgi:hypothetical protein